MRTKMRQTEYVNIVIMLTGLLVLNIMMSQAKLPDSDFFWHTTIGRDILRTFSVPREDTYSWLSAEYGLMETAHSWAAGVVLYLCTLPFAVNPVYGALLYCSVTFALFEAVVYVLYLRRIESDALRSIAVIAAAIAGVLTFRNARPQNIGYILFAAGICVLIKLYENPNRKLLILAPVISLLWANFHGGAVPMYFAFNLLFLVLTFVRDFEFGQVYSRCADRLKSRKYLLAALGLNLAAGLCNPYGAKLYIYFFVTNNSVTKKYVGEWQHGALLSFSAIFTLLCFFYVFVLSKQKTPLHKLLPLVITFGLSGIHIRIGEYSYLFAVILLSECFCQMRTDIKRVRTDISCIVCAGMAVLLGIFMSGAVGAPIILQSNPLTDELLDYLDEKKFSRLYNDYNTGGYLIFEGYPSFVDSRADLFTDDILKDSFSFASMSFETPEEYQKFYDDYRFDGLLVRKKEGTRPLLMYLNKDENWTVDYEDTEWLVFVPAA